MHLRHTSLSPRLLSGKCFAVQHEADRVLEVFRAHTGSVSMSLEHFVCDWRIACERDTEYFDCGGSCNARKLWQWLVALTTSSIFEDYFSGLIMV
jgi:hypothetical protein